MSAQPLYRHDCRGCTFLGTTEVPSAWAGKPAPAMADWYGCKQGGNLPTIIARFSDDGPDYHSGWPPATGHEDEPFFQLWRQKAEEYGRV